MCMKPSDVVRIFLGFLSLLSHLGSLYNDNDNASVAGVFFPVKQLQVLRHSIRHSNLYPPFNLSCNKTILYGRKSMYFFDL